MTRPSFVALVAAATLALGAPSRAPDFKLPSTRGKDVTLPKAATVDDNNKNDPLVLSVTADGKIWVENDLVDERGLEARVGEALKRAPGKKVMLKGDEKVTVGEVRKVMDLARQGGARGVALAVEQKK